MKKSIDKRNHDRIKTPHLEVEYKIQGSDTVYSAQIVNVAAGGMCFLRKSIINKNDLLTIKFPFKTQKILLNGQVIRIEGREVALKFIDSDEDIGRFVDVFNKEYHIIAKTAGEKKNRLRLHEDDDQGDRGPGGLLDLD